MYILLPRLIKVADVSPPTLNIPNQPITPNLPMPSGIKDLMIPDKASPGTVTKSPPSTLSKWVSTTAKNLTPIAQETAQVAHKVKNLDTYVPLAALSNMGKSVQNKFNTIKTNTGQALQTGLQTALNSPEDTWATEINKLPTLDQRMSAKRFIGDYGLHSPDNLYFKYLHKPLNWAYENRPWLYGGAGLAGLYGLYHLLKGRDKDEEKRGSIEKKAIVDFFEDISNPKLGLLRGGGGVNASHLLNTYGQYMEPHERELLKAHMIRYGTATQLLPKDLQQLSLASRQRDGLLNALSRTSEEELGMLKPMFGITNNPASIAMREGFGTKPGVPFDLGPGFRGGAGGQFTPQPGVPIRESILKHLPAYKPRGVLDPKGIVPTDTPLTAHNIYHKGLPELAKDNYLKHYLNPQETAAWKHFAEGPYAHTPMTPALAKQLGQYAEGKGMLPSIGSTSPTAAALIERFGEGVPLRGSPRTGFGGFSKTLGGSGPTSLLAPEGLAPKTQLAGGMPGMLMKAAPRTMLAPNPLVSGVGPAFRGAAIKSLGKLGRPF